MTRSARPRTVNTLRHKFRPRLDALEERQLLAAGALDTATFNPPKGYVLGTSGNAYWGVRVQSSDGKIVAAGGTGSSFMLTRYNPNGSLDSTFGSGGVVQTSFGSSSQSRDLD